MTSHITGGGYCLLTDELFLWSGGAAGAAEEARVVRRVEGGGEPGSLARQPVPHQQLVGQAGQDRLVGRAGGGRAREQGGRPGRGGGDRREERAWFVLWLRLGGGEGG